MAIKERKILVTLPKPHSIQQAIIDSKAKRKIIRAGRRSGKTIVASIIAVQAFLDRHRVLYAAPTEDQLATFWFAIKSTLQNPIDAEIFRKNEVFHTFIYTPPSLRSRSVSKARDPLHASKTFKKAQEDKTGRWAAFHFSSFDNPYISHEALKDITQDMTRIAYRQEILAEDIEEAPGALWTRELINETRVTEHPDLVRIIVGVDPTGSRGNECGIVVAGLGDDGEGYILDDRSLLGSPGEWADEVLNAYNLNNADIIVGETNYGGDMVEATIKQAGNTQNQIYRYKNVHATRGKAVRAEPIVAAYEHGKVHHVGEFPHLENEMVMWIPGESRYSPNRIDALVWAMTELDLKADIDSVPLDMMSAHSKLKVPGFGSRDVPSF